MSDAANLKEFYIEVRRGNIPRHRIVHKFGNNIIVANGVWSLVSPVSIASAMPASGSRVRIKAGGNADDTVDGLGCRSVELIGINENFEEVSEIITTSGTGISASSIHSYWRLHRLKATDVGTYGGANNGVITFENINGDADRLLLRASEGQSQHGMWSTPVGKTAYVLGIYVESDGAKAADFRLLVRKNYDIVTTPMHSVRLKIFFDGVMGQTTSRTKTPSIELPEKTDIWISARGGGAQTEVSVDIEILLIDNPVVEIKRI